MQDKAVWALSTAYKRRLYRAAKLGNIAGIIEQNQQINAIGIEI